MLIEVRIFFVWKQQFLYLIQLVINQAKFPTFLINPPKRLKLALRLVCNADSAKTYKNGLVLLVSHLNSILLQSKHISLNFAGSKNWEFQKSLIQNTRPMALQDCWWPCAIVFGLARSLLALPRSFLALRDRFGPYRDRFWSYEIVFGLVRLLMALQDRFWPCEIVFGLTRSFWALPRSFLALQDRFWPCKTVDGLARSFLFLWDRFWPCEIVVGLVEIVFGLARSFLALRDRC